MKTNKSFAKRLKVSRNGKIKARNPGQNHFNAKERHSTRGNKGRTSTLSMNKKDRARYLTGTN